MRQWPKRPTSCLLLLPLATSCQFASCGSCQLAAFWQPDLSICSSTVSIRSCDRYLTFFGDQLTPTAAASKRGTAHNSCALLLSQSYVLERVLQILCRYDTRRQLIAANTCQGIQAAAAAAGVGCCNCHCRCLSFALANQDLSPANDTTWRGLARRSPGCQPRLAASLTVCYLHFGIE